MAEGVSPNAKKVKMDGLGPEERPTAAGNEHEGKGAINGNGRIAFVTGITGQVRWTYNY